jgi:hypothetical protein
MTSTLRRTEKHEVLAYNATSVFVSVPDTFAPTTFRFSEINPVVRNKTYAESMFRDLPDWAMNVVLDAGYRMHTWNALVRNRTVMEVGAFRAEHPFASGKDWARTVARREKQGPPKDGNTCEECWGTGLSHDYDASVTGIRNAPYVCFCYSAGMR